MRAFVKIVAIAFIAFAFLSGCPKAQTGVSGAGETPPVEQPKPTDVTATILRNQLSLWKMADNAITSKTDWLATLNLGDTVVLLNESADVTFDGGKDKIKVTKIKTEAGKEGWVFADYVALGGPLAVVIDENCVLYSEPKTIKVTSQTVGRTTVLMSIPVAGNSEFVQVYGYDPVGKAVFTDQYKRFVKIASLTTSDADVQAAIFLAVAKSETNAAKKKNLLVEANKQFSGSAFANELAMALGEADPDNAPLPPVESVGTALTCKDKPAKVFAKPFATAKTTGEVPAGESVIALEATVSDFTVNGVKAKWYRIDAPAAGWIFGADFTE